MENNNERIKEKFSELLEKKIVNGEIKGPTKNVLVCDTKEDWIIACSELIRSGYSATSPGGYGGSHPVSRQTTHNRLWLSGMICGVQFTENRKPMTWLFGLVREEIQPYLDIIH